MHLCTCEQVLLPLFALSRTLNRCICVWSVPGRHVPTSPVPPLRPLLKCIVFRVHGTVTVPVPCVHAKQIVFPGELWTSRVHVGGRPVIYANLCRATGKTDRVLLASLRAVRRDLTKTICLAVTLHRRIASRAGISCSVIYFFVCCVQVQPSCSGCQPAIGCKSFEKSFGVYKH